MKSVQEKNLAPRKQNITIQINFKYVFLGEGICTCAEE